MQKKQAQLFTGDYREKAVIAQGQQQASEPGLIIIFLNIYRYTTFAGISVCREEATKKATTLAQISRKCKWQNQGTFVHLSAAVC